MAQRLRDILGKLRKPPTDGASQIFALSTMDAERLPQLPSIAVISITAPERAPTSIGELAHVLGLSFADVDILNPDLSDRARSRLADAFPPKQAQAIRAFVESLPREIVSPIVHREGGYSRSRGVATPLHQLYGYAAELQHLPNANMSVVRVMMGDIDGNHKSRKHRS